MNQGYCFPKSVGCPQETSSTSEVGSTVQLEKHSLRAGMVNAGEGHSMKRSNALPLGHSTPQLPTMAAPQGRMQPLLADCNLPEEPEVQICMCYLPILNVKPLTHNI